MYLEEIDILPRGLHVNIGPVAKGMWDPFYSPNIKWVLRNGVPVVSSKIMYKIFHR